MLEPVFDFIDRLVTQFSWARLFLVVVIALFLFGVVAFFEYHTGHFELNKLERTVNLVAKVSEVKGEAVGDKKITKILDRVTVEAGELVSPSSVKLELSEIETKGLFSFLPWLIFGMLAVLTSKKKRLKGFVGVILFSIPLAILQSFIPTFSNINVNYYFIPWVTFFVLVCLIVIYQKRKKTR